MASRVSPPPKQPFTSVYLPAGLMYRVHEFNPHTGKYRPNDFNDSGHGNARFSPILTPTGKIIPTLYAANTMRGAIMETALHDVPFPASGYIHDIQRDLDSTLHMSAIRIGDLRLVNLQSTGLRAAGLRPSHLFDGDKRDYARTRKWAAWIWAEYPKAQGVIWMSKQDNQSRSIMLFGDRIAEPIEDLGQTSHIAAHEDLIIALLAEMGATVTSAF